jgi:AraC-like DNA-binding protein
MTAILEPRLLRRPATMRAYEDAVRAVIAHIRAVPEEPLDLAAMAAIAGVSRSHFDRVFRAVTAVSPRQFQTAVRMQRAARLLLTTDRSVTEICFDTGYESLGSFVTKFTQTFLLSPQRMRELAGKPFAPHAPAHARPPFVSGTITASMELNGLIFLGLFPERMPAATPLACCITTRPGAFVIGDVPRGEHHLLAVALPWPQRPLDFVLSDNAPRGSGGVVRAGMAADLALLALTEVVLGPVWAWLVVGEVPAFWTLVGGAIVLSATAVQAVAGARRLAG